MTLAAFEDFSIRHSAFDIRIFQTKRRKEFVKTEPLFSSLSIDLKVQPTGSYLYTISIVFGEQSELELNVRHCFIQPFDANKKVHPYVFEERMHFNTPSSHSPPHYPHSSQRMGFSQHFRLFFAKAKSE